MMVVYAVIWGSSSCDDDDNAHACTGVHGIYTTEELAKAGLEESKLAIIADAQEAFDPDDEMPDDFDREVKVYGSLEENYFEVDYTLGTEPVEVRTEIIKTCVQN